jgi:hypothetical protein
MPAPQMTNPTHAPQFFEQMHDLHGVLFRSTYIRDDKNTPVICTVHILDSAYLPIGPNLASVLDKLVTASRVSADGSVLELTHVLSVLIKDYKDV